MYKSFYFRTNRKLKSLSLSHGLRVSFVRYSGRSIHLFVLITSDFSYQSRVSVSGSCKSCRRIMDLKTLNLIVRKLHLE